MTLLAVPLIWVARLSSSIGPRPHRTPAQSAGDCNHGRTRLSSGPPPALAARRRTRHRTDLWPGHPRLALHANLLQRPDLRVRTLRRLLRPPELLTDRQQTLSIPGRHRLGYCLPDTRRQPDHVAPLPHRPLHRRPTRNRPRAASTAELGRDDHPARPPLLAALCQLSRPRRLGRHSLPVVELCPLRQHLGQRLRGDRTLQRRMDVRRQRTARRTRARPPLVQSGLAAGHTGLRLVLATRPSHALLCPHPVRHLLALLRQMVHVARRL